MGPPLPGLPQGSQSSQAVPSGSSQHQEWFHGSTACQGCPRLQENLPGQILLPAGCRASSLLITSLGCDSKLPQSLWPAQLLELSPWVCAEEPLEAQAWQKHSWVCAGGEDPQGQHRECSAPTEEPTSCFHHPVPAFGIFPALEWPGSVLEHLSGLRNKTAAEESQTHRAAASHTADPGIAAGMTENAPPALAWREQLINHLVPGPPFSNWDGFTASVICPAKG